MANRIRGKKRQEIIDNWLKGIEDPDVEVKPTKKDNRYIVTSKKPVQDDSATDTSVTDTSNKKVSVTDTSNKKVSVKDTSVKERPVKKVSNKLDTSDDSYEYEYEYEEEPETQGNKHNAELLQYEILNELRRMNEEKARREEEKERRRELKHQIQHQLYRQSMRTESVSQQPQNEVRPIQRRRLNLLGRF